MNIMNIYRLRLRFIDTLLICYYSIFSHDNFQILYSNYLPKLFANYLTNYFFLKKNENEKK